MLQSLHAWKPDFVLIQHEFGIFPRAGEWLKLLAGIDEFPYAVVLHSVYEHLDKAVCTSTIRNVICHTESGEACLKRLGFRGNVTVIPHGCMDLGDVDELWNHYQVDYPLMQFGFGFTYKGLETAFEALALLKERKDRKYEDVFFTYLCSETPHTRNINAAYHDRLIARRNELGLAENVVVLRGYQAEEDLFRFLRVNRLAIFPYRSDPENVVHGASGAVRLAFANRTPAIASDSPMFSDLEGVVPRPGTAADLAREIDRAFSDGEHRRRLVDRASEFAAASSWTATASRYADAMSGIIAGGETRRLIRTS